MAPGKKAIEEMRLWRFAEKHKDFILKMASNPKLLAKVKKVTDRSTER